MLGELWRWTETTASYRLLIRVLVVLQVVSVPLTIWSAADTGHVNLNAFITIPVTVGLVKGREWAHTVTKFTAAAGFLLLPVVLVLWAIDLGGPVFIFGWRVSSIPLLALLLVPMLALQVWTLRALRGHEAADNTTLERYRVDDVRI